MKDYPGEIKSKELDKIYAELVQYAVRDKVHYQYVIGCHRISTKMSLDTCYQIIEGVDYYEYQRLYKDGVHK